MAVHFKDVPCGSKSPYGLDITNNPQDITCRVCKAKHSLEKGGEWPENLGGKTRKNNDKTALKKGYEYKCFNCGKRNFKAKRNIMFMEIISELNIEGIGFKIKNGQEINCNHCKQAIPNYHFCSPLNWFPPEKTKTITR